MTHKTSVFALILYTTAILAVLKWMGASLTWAMVFSPIWGLGVLFILCVAIISIILGGVT